MKKCSLISLLVITIYHLLLVSPVLATIPFKCMSQNIVPTITNQRFFGLAANQPAEPTRFKNIMTKISGSGLSMIRVGIKWTEVEKTQGQYDWSDADEKINAIHSNNMKPLIILHTTASWASSKPNDLNAIKYPPLNINDWKNFVRQMVKHYGIGGNNMVKDWEILNEPDIDNYFLGTPEQYVNLLNTAYSVIKEEDPQARVWGPATFNITTNSPKFVFTETAVKQGKMDIFSIHVYAKTVDEIYKKTKNIRQYLDNHGKKNIPLALTESNLSGPLINEQCPYKGIESDTPQVDVINDIYLCNAAAGADYVFWYKATDSPTSTDICPDGLNRNGILHQDLTPKPALDRLNQLIDKFVPNDNGDIDNNGQIDLVDYFYYIAAMFNGKLPLTIKNRVDINHDGKINYQDRQIIINQLKNKK